VGYSRLDGSMKRADRTNAIVSFQTDPETVVMLVSIKAGGVGYVHFLIVLTVRLNLTAASHVFVFEPAWNPAIEQQAIDRVHRLGQTSDVQVIRYIAKGTVLLIPC
jgi:SWI/SNF-related matrix-associated actin-dependent regulator of chromatin subfamily A3